MMEKSPRQSVVEVGFVALMRDDLLRIVGAGADVGLVAGGGAISH